MSQLSPDFKRAGPKLPSKAEPSSEPAHVDTDLHDLLRSVGIPILVLDPALSVRRFTAAVEPLFNLRGSDLGRNVRELRPNLELPDFEAMLRRVIRSQEAEQHEVNDSSGRMYSMWIRPHLTRDEEADGAVVAFFDLTEHRRAELERDKAEQEKARIQRLESLGAMAGGIAHDFNNLLGTIIGNAELIREALPPESLAQEHLRQLEAATARAAELSQQMLVYSGRGLGSLRPVDVVATVKAAARSLEPTLPHGVQLHLAMASGLPTIHADKGQIHQVVVNLLTNAIEALPDGKGTVTVTTGLTGGPGADLGPSVTGAAPPAKEYLFLEVQDEGVGMTPEVQARIFDPFFTTKFTGRGLGLAVVFGIVRGHLGSVLVSSVPGQGSTFRVLLPSTCASLTAPPASPPQELPLPAGAPWKGTGRSILVVDDEVMLREVVSRSLRGAGFEVLTASSSSEALALVREKGTSLDAVVLDATMPDDAAHGTLSELRKLSTTMPVVLMSGFSEEVVAPRLFGDPHAAFLGKPFRFADLQAKLRRLLGA